MNGTRTGLLLGAVLIVLAAVGSLAQRGSAEAATSLTLVAAADTYVTSASPATAYGTATRMTVDGSPVSRSFVRFSLSSVTGTVRSARLRLHVSNVSGAQSAAGGSVKVVSNTSWPETTTTWNNQPLIDGPVLATFGAVARNSWVEVNLSSTPLAGTVFSLAITSANSDAAIYDTRQSGATAPQLILTVDPATTLVPVADAYVDGDTPSTNYGAASQLIADGAPVRETYLRFDLSGLSGTVKDARLRIHVAATTNAGTPWGGTVAVIGDNAWAEQSITYDTRPVAWGPTVAALGTVAMNSWIEVNVTAAVTTGGPLTFGIRSSNPDGGYYDSRESGITAPRLVVTLGPPPAVANGIVIAAVGDMACAPGGAVTATTCRQQQLSDLIANDPGVEFFLALGDLQYENGELANYQAAYDPSYGRFKAKTKPSPGNHEYNTANAAGYYSYFGSLAGDPSKGYYSFDAGTTWHVIALNSNCSSVACAAGSAQEQWLRADLAATSRTCILAFWHHARFSSGAGHGDNTTVAPFWDALQAYGADLALVGHEHVYERFVPQLPSGAASAAGITEFLVGTGGKNLTAFGAAKATSALRLPAFGILRLTLGDGAYQWQFIDESGGVLDSGIANCH